MERVMDINRAKRYVLDTVRAYTQTDDDGIKLIDSKLQRPLFLIGPPGIGKTAIMTQVASELGIGLISYSMTHHTRQSALGLPKIEHRNYKGYEYDASEYTMSEIISSIYDYMEKSGTEQGILFLDEVNCVSETLYPSMLQFLQFKTFGKHAVPEGWVIVCAGNPPEYNRSVHEFDIVTMDRLRKIEVEPSVEAWKAYAANAGVHPAVTTFLETQKDFFYRIESTPGGKRFVTARGWDDLSRMISICEVIGTPVEQELIEQFVQDPEIAEKFSLYYDLFRKYRSDYQVPTILAGTISDDIVERAKEARFDERLALLGLMLDALTPHAADIVVQETVLTNVRDILREAKAALMAGGTVDQVLEPALAQCESRLARMLNSNVASADAVRQEKRAIDILKACRNACVRAGADAGEPAFEALHPEFRGYVGAFEADVTAFREELDNAYAFLERAFGQGRETVLFTTELAARKPTTLFISRYGCDSFARHSQELQTVENRADLMARIDSAKSAEAAGEKARDLTLSADEVSESAAAPKIVATSAPAQDMLEAYYKNACWEFGYASLCHMALPANLQGKLVVDVGCRRGKGVFKLSERVGERGHAIGVDWVPEHIAEAASRADRAARETGLPSNNMEFHLAYPEDLLTVGLGDNTADVVFTNSILHLMCDPRVALAEMHRVLKPGGLLILEVALATSPRDRAVVEEARKLGNSIQAAPGREEFERYLEDLGFELTVDTEPKPVEASMGFKKGHEVPVAASAEDVSFEALVLHAVKK